MDAETLCRGYHRAAIERVVGRMREAADGPLSLGEMADLACLSPFHFSRVFRRLTGVSPGAFQTALRLERAKRLLIESDMPVTEVCFEVGYASLGSFTTRFTQSVGVSPGRLRRLPEAAADRLASLERACPRGIPATPAAAGVVGRVDGPVPVGGLISLGLFPAAIPEGPCAAATVLGAPGGFRIAPVPDGHYHVMATVLPRADAPRSFLLPAAGAVIGCAGGPVTVDGGRGARPVVIARRGRRNRPIRRSSSPCRPCC